MDTQVILLIFQRDSIYKTCLNHHSEVIRDTDLLSLTLDMGDRLCFSIGMVDRFCFLVLFFVPDMGDRLCFVVIS
jgi:hypothetical protein